MPAFAGVYAAVGGLWIALEPRHWGHGSGRRAISKVVDEYSGVWESLLFIHRKLREVNNVHKTAIISPRFVNECKAKYIRIHGCFARIDCQGAAMAKLSRHSCVY